MLYCCWHQLLREGWETLPNWNTDVFHYLVQPLRKAEHPSDCWCPPDGDVTKLGNVQIQPEQCQRQREQSQLLGRLGAVAFPPGKVHTESSKNKQEFKAEKGCRAESVLSSLQSSSPWGMVQLVCWATSGEHRAPTAHCASEVNLRAFSKTCDLWVQAIDQKKNVVITCVGEIGKGQGTIRNNLYDWVSRFNTLLCYSLRNPFQTCRKKPISNAKLLFRPAEKGQSLMPNQWLCRERSLVCCHCATTYIWWCALRIYHLLIFATPSSLIPCKEGQTEACLFWSQNIYH